jgi:hypothetical protein
METKNKMSSPHPRIVVSLPDIQDQTRLINRAAATATEQEQGRWEDLKTLLGELYAQLQRQDKVTVYRLAKRGASKPGAPRD